MLDYRFHYRRNLPHFQPVYARFFVTFRLAGSIPIPMIERLTYMSDCAMREATRVPDVAERRLRIYEEERRAFGRWDVALHSLDAGPRWLEDSRIARVVADSLSYRDGRVYSLDAFCIMPNHAHLVFAPLLKDETAFHSLASILHSLKMHTARQANRILNRQGEFWQHENYDHTVRDELEHRRIIDYVLNNPVKAGLVDQWQDWPWCYVSPEL